MADAAIRRLARLCTWAAVAAILVMMAGTCWDILARQFFNRPLHGVVELVEITVLISAMLGLPEAFLRDEQIQIDLVDSMLSPRALAAVKAVTLLATVAFLALLAWVIWQPMLDARRFGDIKYDLGVRVWLLYALTLLALLVSLLTVLFRLWQALTGTESEKTA